MDNRIFINIITTIEGGSMFYFRPGPLIPQDRPCVSCGSSTDGAAEEAAQNGPTGSRYGSLAPSCLAVYKLIDRKKKLKCDLYIMFVHSRRHFGHQYR